MSGESWDQYFSELAFQVASRSKDPSTKVGCVLVGPEREIRATGYNGFPRNCDDSEIESLPREEKYRRTVHAETNSVATSARVGTPLKGCIAYITAFPCSTCMGTLIQAGITEVIVCEPPSEELEERWKEHFETARLLAAQGSVKIRTLIKE